MIVPEEKFILDATAGHRMMWSNKKHPNVIFLDERPEVKPDIVGDFRDLKQFPAGTFRLIIFDPPHLDPRWQKGKAGQEFIERFGCLVPETWQSDLRRGFEELWRVLEQKGILIFKWNDHDHSVAQVLRIAKKAGLTPLFGHNSKAGQRSSTHWFCFMKIQCISQRNIGETEK